MQVRIRDEFGFDAKAVEESCQEIQLYSFNKSRNIGLGITGLAVCKLGFYTGPHQSLEEA